MSPPQKLSHIQQRLTFRHLRLIVALDETRSMSKAASHLCVTQAAVSKTRAEIDDLLEMPVFEYRDHRWEPTGLGQQIVRAARRVIAEMETFGSEFQLLKEGLVGSVTIGYRTISLSSFLADTTAAFKQAHPALTVQLVEGQWSDLLERMRRGKIDLIVSPLNELADQGDLGHEVLRVGRHAIVASCGHPLQEHRDLQWADLVEQSWCVTPRETRTRIHLEHLIKEHGLAFPRNVIEAGSFFMTMLLLGRMPLLSLLPAEALAFLEPNIACELDIRMPQLVDPVNLVWSTAQPMSPAARRFREFALDHARATLTSHRPPPSTSG